VRERLGRWFTEHWLERQLASVRLRRCYNLCISCVSDGCELAFENRHIASQFKRVIEVSASSELSMEVG